MIGIRMIAGDKTAIQLPRNIEIYQDRVGKAPFERWRLKQKGNRGAAIDEALDRVRDGKTVKVKGYDGRVGAIILTWPTKLRIYFGLADDLTLVLLGGDEGSQDEDIEQAKVCWEDYLTRVQRDG
jgi:putative addiction module killer protein